MDIDDIDKAIKLLSDYCDRGSLTLDDDFKAAVKMGKKALTIIAHNKALRWDDLSLQLLLGAERRPDGARES